MDSNTPTYEQIASEVFHEAMTGQLGDIWRERFKNTEFCERCKKNPPEVITQVSSYICCCRKCEEEIYKEIDKSINHSLNEDY